jgi:hypothetical protein
MVCLIYITLVTVSFFVIGGGELLDDLFAYMILLYKKNITTKKIMYEIYTNPLHTRSHLDQLSVLALKLLHRSDRLAINRLGQHFFL